MAKALKCDRCGQFYDYIKCLRRYQIRDTEKEKLDKTIIDLCPDCYAKLLRFLDLFDNLEYPGEFESRHYEFEDCDNIKGEREDSDGSSNT